MSNRERTPVSVERANAETAAAATPEIPGGYPDLTASQLDLIRERSTETVVDPGASLGDAGDVDYDFVLVEAGDVEVVRLAAFGLPEQVMAIFGPGSFLGELDMLNGQAAMFSARMPAGGVIQRMPRPVFRQLMSDAPELSDVILRAFMARLERFVWYRSRWVGAWGSRHLGGPRQRLRVDILSDVREFAVSNGNGKDPMVLPRPIRGFDSPPSEADDHNPVSLRYVFGGLWE